MARNVIYYSNIKSRAESISPAFDFWSFTSPDCPNSNWNSQPLSIAVQLSFATLSLLFGSALAVRSGRPSHTMPKEWQACESFSRNFEVELTSALLADCGCPEKTVSRSTVCESMERHRSSLLSGTNTPTEMMVAHCTGTLHHYRDHYCFDLHDRAATE